MKFPAMTTAAVAIIAALALSACQKKDADNPAVPKVDTPVASPAPATPTPADSATPAPMTPPADANAPAGAAPAPAPAANPGTK